MRLKSKLNTAVDRVATASQHLVDAKAELLDVAKKAAKCEELDSTTRAEAKRQWAKLEGGELEGQ